MALIVTFDAPPKQKAPISARWRLPEDRRLLRGNQDENSYCRIRGYMAAADTVTPTLQLLFLVCGTSGNDNTAPTVATSLAMLGCQSRHWGE